MRRTLRWLFVAFVLGLIGGFVPVSFVSHERKVDLDRSTKDLRASRMHAELMAAALDAQSGNYARSREELSRFFTAFELEYGQQPGGAAVPAGPIQQVIKQRDDLITLLARSDPASGDRLAKLEVGVRHAFPI